MIHFILDCVLQDRNRNWVGISNNYNGMADAKIFVVMGKYPLMIAAIAGMAVTGCESDMSANDPYKNSPAYQSNSSVLTNYPPAPTAPTGPVPQNNSAVNQNMPPNVPYPANVAPPPTNRPAVNPLPPP
jgi:hypothetical protein